MALHSIAASHMLCYAVLCLLCYIMLCYASGGAAGDGGEDGGDAGGPSPLGAPLLSLPCPRPFAPLLSSPPAAADDDDGLRRGGVLRERAGAAPPGGGADGVGAPGGPARQLVHADRHRRDDQRVRPPPLLISSSPVRPSPALCAALLLHARGSLQALQDPDGWVHLAAVGHPVEQLRVEGRGGDRLVDAARDRPPDRLGRGEVLHEPSGDHAPRSTRHPTACRPLRARLRLLLRPLCADGWRAPPGRRSRN